MHRLRGVRAPFCVTNSEPAKLAVARIPISNLAERFILVDDDMFMVPPQTPGYELSTRIFFDARGLPIHTHSIYSSHLPHPMLRDAYKSSAMREWPPIVESLLSSCAARNRARGQLDRLPNWANHMWRHGTAVPVKFPPVKSTDFYMNNADVSQVPALVSKFDRYLFSQSLWLEWTEQNGFKTAKLIEYIAVRFFAKVRKYRPYYICVNDDFPLDEPERTDSIRPFREFLSYMYPRPAPWEIAMPLGQNADATTVKSDEPFSQHHLLQPLFESDEEPARSSR